MRWVLVQMCWLAVGPHHTKAGCAGCSVGAVQGLAKKGCHPRYYMQCPGLPKVVAGLGLANLGLNVQRLFMVLWQRLFFGGQGLGWKCRWGGWVSRCMLQRLLSMG